MATYTYFYINSIRLIYFPTKYKTNNYSCALTFNYGETAELQSVSYNGFADFEDKATSYNAFVRSLASAVATSNPHCVFYSGKKPGRYILEQLLTFTAIALPFSILCVVGSTGITSFVLLKFVLIAWHLYYIRKAFKVNLPGRFDPLNIPRKLLPDPVKTDEIIAF